MSLRLPSWLTVESELGPNGCLIWTGPEHKGYPVSRNGEFAHRRAYRQVVGPFDPALEIDHLCRVPMCVNPSHLEPVTRAENMRRRYEPQATCRHGHLFDLANTYVKPSGHRQCRACNRAAVARYAARRKAVVPAVAAMGGAA